MNQPLGSPGTSIDICGEACIRITMNSGDREEDWRLAHSVARWLRQTGASDEVTGLIPTYDSLLVEFDATVRSATEMRALIAAGVDEMSSTVNGEQTSQHRHFDVPVLYGGPDGPDLQFVAELMNWSIEELIEAHTAKTYTVRCYGSPAASPMLDAPELPRPVPRLSSPRAKVPAGVISLAGRQATIAPASAPGGWQVIGRTPLTVLDLEAEPMVPYRPGDSIRFHRIDQAAYQALLGRPLEAAS